MLSELTRFLTVQTASINLNELWRCFLQCNINIVTKPLERPKSMPTLGQLLGLALSDLGNTVKELLVQWETSTQQ